ncbi:hypothetical protein [Mycoplasma buteonis]|uniref:hypothetical protein n=1 Tax=Mycoplasma buteonis TaxID=171280 RepID=UPI00056613F4|nr:hypothetical protein [Mycoplasma buteonis]
MNKKLNLFVFLQLKRLYKNNRFENLKNIKVDKNIYVNLIEYSKKVKQMYLITSAFLLLISVASVFISLFLTKTIFGDFITFDKTNANTRVMLVFNVFLIFVMDLLLFIAFSMHLSIFIFSIKILKALEELEKNNPNLSEERHIKYLIFTEKTDETEKTDLFRDKYTLYSPEQKNKRKGIENAFFKFASDQKTLLYLFMFLVHSGYKFKELENTSLENFADDYNKLFETK